MFRVEIVLSDTRSISVGGIFYFESRSHGDLYVEFIHALAPEQARLLRTFNARIKGNVLAKFDTATFHDYDYFTIRIDNGRNLPTQSKTR